MLLCNLEQQIEVDDNTDVATYVAGELSHLASKPRPDSRFQNGFRGRQEATSSPYAVYVGSNQQSAILEQIWHYGHDCAIEAVPQIVNRR